jgi:uncharacterized membrane protein
MGRRALMNIAAFLSAPMTVQMHALAALTALILGTVQLLAPKGTLPHRVMGWLWIGLMAVAALSSFVFVWGPGFDGLGPIHILSVATLLSLVTLVRAARKGQIRAHRSNALWLFIAALVITGAFTLLPGRLMHCVAFTAPGMACQLGGS